MGPLQPQDVAKGKGFGAVVVHDLMILLPLLKGSSSCGKVGWWEFRTGSIMAVLWSRLTNTFLPLKPAVVTRAIFLMPFRKLSNFQIKTLRWI